MSEFSPFNQILLSLFDVLNAFLSKHWSENELNDVKTYLTHKEIIPIVLCFINTN